MTRETLPRSEWVTLGSVRVTASEWELLRLLITTPSLQTASNAELEQLRTDRPFSSVATDIEELMSKGLIMVHSSTKERRTIHLTEATREALVER